MKDGIRIKVIWFDVDMIELRIDGSNGRFAGSVECYDSHDALPQLANAIRGFPVSVTDIRLFELGELRDTYAGGGIRMQFRCTNRTGHPAVEVFMRSDPILQGDEMARFEIMVEPAGIDDFVTQLDNMKVEGSFIACLQRVT